MKEVTYEDWLKNPTPRSMWVWDEDEELKVKRKVIYILKDGVYTSPVLVVVDECMYETFRHCAEIEKQRQMTNKELFRWLRENPTRECKYDGDSYVYVNECMYETFRHYAEIGKQRRMTNKELSRWLRENTTRECKWINKDLSNSDYVYTNHVYLERSADEEVDSSIVIREDDGEWREPLVEVGE